MLAASVASELHSVGLVHLRPGFDPAVADRLRALVWRGLAPSGIKESDPTTWPHGRIGKASTRSSVGHRAFQSFWSEEVTAALDALLVAGEWTRPEERGSILLTFPEPGAPVSRLDPFHSDFAMDVPAEPLFAVVMFAFIGAVPPRSGGTLVMRSSHHVVRRYLEGLPPGFQRSRAATQFAADHRSLRALDTIGATYDCEGIEVRVEELTGEPGDVVITHPWTLHAGASSEGTVPRMMLRHRVFRTA